jgi:alpha-glucosidase (family GH31 glycosyl hydrolase)
MTHPWRSLTIALCPCGDVRAATEMALGTHEPPGAAPHPQVLRDPIWTTWARYHKRVDQAKVLQYAQEICDRGLGRSVMEIDDMWQTRYGDLAFNRKKFPDPKAMVDKLHALGFRVTLWVMPFAEEDSEAFRFGAPRGYFIRGSGVAAKRREGRADPHGRGHFFNWWNTPRVAALDVTNPEAVEWFVGRLKALQAEVGVDGFKFDGGEPCFLPRGFRTHAPIAHPSEYSELYVREVAGRFEGDSFCEVRTGHRTQNVGVLTRMGDRFSTWGVDNGLRSIIPTLLTSGLLGYPFCLPDMVGGNAYFGVKPDRELLVRWMQASAFMPSLQISIPPWDLDEGADQLCKQALEARAHVLGDIGELARGAAGRLTPIARPMWWLDPRDPETFGIDDQFALGDDLIVAPVVEKGARARDVYLTEGTWRDLLRGGEVVQGGRWLRGHDAPLDHIPCFARVAP